MLLDKLINIISNHLKNIIVFFIVFISLFLSFQKNVFNAVGDYEFYTFQKDSEDLIYSKIIASEDNQIFNGGFLGRYSLINKDYEKGDIRKVFKGEIERSNLGDFKGYYPQIGLQGRFFSLISKIIPFSNNIKITIFESINSFLMSFFITVLCMWIKKEFGNISFVFVLFVTLYNPWLTQGARNLYWCFWIYIAIFVCNLLILDYIIDLNKQLKYTRYLTFVLIFIKCGFGYEFITTALILSELPVIYMTIKNQWTRKRFLVLFTNIAIAGLLAFFLNIVTLFILAYIANLGSDIYTSLFNSVQKRTGLGGINNLPKEHYLSLNSNVFRILITYILDSKPSIFLKQNMLSILSLSSIIILCKFDVIKENRKVLALFITTCISSLSIISWLVLAKGHAYYHTHINFVLWSLPFLILLSATLGSLIQKVIGSRL